MGFKLGVLVSYNGENWVIIDMQEKEISNGHLTFLKIKNILTSEIININASEVKEVEVKPRRVAEKEAELESLEDTQYINALFNDLDDDDTENFFGLGTEETNFRDIDIELEKIDEDEIGSKDDRVLIKKENVYKNIVENFQIPEHQVHYTSRRNFISGYDDVNNRVDETLSDINPIGEIKTQIPDENTNIFNENLEAKNETNIFQEETIDNKTIIKPRPIENLDKAQFIEKDDQTNTKDAYDYETNHNENTQNVEIQTNNLDNSEKTNNSILENTNIHQNTTETLNTSFNKDIKEEIFLDDQKENISDEKTHHSIFDIDKDTNAKPFDNPKTFEETLNKNFDKDEKTFNLKSTFEEIQNKVDKDYTSIQRNQDIKSDSNNEPTIENKFDENKNQLYINVEKEEQKVDIAEENMGQLTMADHLMEKQELQEKLSKSFVKNPQFINFEKTYSNNNFQNKAEKDFILDANQKVVVGLTKRADKAIENNANLNEDDALNTKKLIDNYNKQQKISENFAENFKYYDNEDQNTMTIFEENNRFDQSKLKDSKVYRKFKKMTISLIILFVLSLLIPLISFVTKSVVLFNENSFNNLSGNEKITKILKIYLFEESGLNNANILFAIDILLVFISPVIFLTFSIYCITYIVIVNDRQYKGLAHYNYQVGKNLVVMDQIQDYNNESSLYLLKVHNDIKKIRKEIKILKNKSEKASINDKKIESINIPH
ncbi:hypothetical protein SHELI_v1c02370 [Spiroplasma helicoides]|uniref:Uncharacterized protein n=1 Tax=Spiroplasma helicoides TaxID=216938 RepID=A0A1B3SJT7_9MOLU|nr:hypothetical protein [Spiroplasma helicoides]AOG60192.1 hypothetical protein SHELI_v1c02370 [Spiroplasma helicoides]